MYVRLTFVPVTCSIADLSRSALLMSHYLADDAATADDDDDVDDDGDDPLPREEEGRW